MSCSLLGKLRAGDVQDVMNDFGLCFEAINGTKTEGRPRQDRLWLAALEGLT